MRRLEQIQVLVRQLGAVLSKRPGRALVVCGESGIGKTHVVEQVLAHVPCASARVTAKAALETWLEPPLEHASNVEGLIAALKNLVPFVLVLEDAHEADTERRALIARLARAVKRTRGLAVVVTQRHQPRGDELQKHVLNRLESDELFDLLRAEAEAALPSAGLEYVFGRSVGHPSYALEFLRYLMRQGHFWSDGARWHWREPEPEFMPITVEALLEERLSNAVKLTQARQVLEARALITPALTDVERLWLEVSGLELGQFDRVRQSLEEHGLLVNGDLAHPLMGELLRRRLRPEARAAYSRRAVRALKHDPIRATIFVNDAALPPKQSVAVINAALQCARGQRKITARLMTQRVALTPAATQGRAAQQAARALLEIDLPTAATMAEMAWASAPGCAEALEVLCEARLLQNQLDDVIALLETAPDQAKKALWHWQLTIRLAHQRGDFIGAIRGWQAHPERQERADSSTVQSLIWSWVETRDGARAKALLQRFLERPDTSLQDRWALLEVRGRLALRDNDLHTAEKDFLQALHLTEHNDAPVRQGALCSHLSELYFIKDDNTSAVTYLERAHRIALEHGSTFQIAQLEVRLGFLKLESARFEEAETLLLRARRALETFPNPALHEADSFLALLYHSWSTPHRAILAQRYAHSALVTARAWGTTFHVLQALYRAVPIELANGQLEVASQHAQEAIELSTEAPPTLQARSQWALARVSVALGTHQKALEHYQNANQTFEAVGDQSLVHQIGLEFDALRGDASRSAEHRDWFESHGLHRLARLSARAIPEPEAPPLEPEQRPPRLLVLGSVQIEVDGKTIAYRGRKRLEFLLHLLEARIAGRAEVSALDLIDALYPNALEPEAKASLKQLVYLLRHQLGSQAIRSTASGYALGRIESDAETYIQTQDSSLWRGPYSEHHHTAWSGAVREKLIATLRRNLAEHAHDVSEIARLSSLWLEMEPLDHDALRTTLNALERADQPQRRLEVQRAAAERFEEVGELIPNHRTNANQRVQN
jgi:hypothetical protein